MTKLRVRIASGSDLLKETTEKVEAILVMPDSFREQQKINLKTYFCSCRGWPVMGNMVPAI